MLERGDNGRQRMERERTAIGSLHHRIQVKSGAVMPWTGHTYSTGDIRFIDQQTLGQSTINKAKDSTGLIVSQGESEGVIG